MNKSRINLGCGPGPIKAMSYLHIDGSRRLLASKLRIPPSIISLVSEQMDAWDMGVVYKNVTKLDFVVNSLDFVYSSHLLEHLYFSDAEALIKRISKGLKYNGVLRLALPDYDSYIQDYLESSKSNPAEAMRVFDENLLSYPLERPNRTKQLKNFFNGNLHTHKWHPTHSLVYDMLYKSGFSQIELKAFRTSLLPEIDLLENRLDKTFFIEAIKD